MFDSIDIVLYLFECVIFGEQELEDTGWQFGEFGGFGLEVLDDLGGVLLGGGIDEDEEVQNTGVDHIGFYGLEDELECVEAEVGADQEHALQERNGLHQGNASFGGLALNNALHLLQ
jgi:hypothetical protein